MPLKYIDCYVDLCLFDSPSNFDNNICSQKIVAIFAS